MTTSTFVARNRATIRDTFLGNWRARYRAAGRDLDITEGADAWMLASALALELEGVEARALALTAEILPDTASDAYVLRHARLIGLDLKPAVAAVHTISVTGSVGASWATTDRLTSAGGVVFVPTAGGSLGSTAGSLSVRALEAGTGGNLAADAVLQWSTAPAGMDTSATLVATTTPGVDVESYRSLARRVLAWWKERPGSGNRADWRDWCESVPGVDRAFVYPLLHPTLGANTLGAVTVVCLAPSPDLVAAAGVLALASDRVEGAGDYVDEGQKRPVTMPAGDYAIVAAIADPTDVTVQVVLGTGFAWPFSGMYTVTSVADARTFDVAPAPAGIPIGSLVAVRLPSTAYARGGYGLAKVSGVAGNTVTLNTDLPAAPAVGATMLPAPDNWTDIRDAILAVFDSLGPGDTSPATRWPAPSDESPATLYHSALVAAVMGVPGLPGAPAGTRGIVSANVIAPAADVTPAARHLATPGFITIQQ